MEVAVMGIVRMDTMADGGVTALMMVAMDVALMLDRIFHGADPSFNIHASVSCVRRVSARRGSIVVCRS
jgi:hypothetical protein